MTEMGTLQIALYVLALIVLIKPVGWYMARVYEGKSCGLNKILSPVENLLYRLSGVDPKQEMNWKTYLVAMLMFNLLGVVFLYALLRLQNLLPLNPQQFPALAPDLAFNTAISFVSNTDWQAYSGENSLSYFSQMLGLGVQNFLSAASGMGIMLAFIRGLTRHETSNLGNFWVDMVRTVIYVLLPLAILLGIFLSSQGVMQNFHPYAKVELLQPLVNAAHPAASMTQQVIPMGPVASQTSIELLGTNGGGFFNANTAHPLINPNPLTNFFEMLALLLIPAALCYTFGKLVGNTHQGWALLVAVFIIFLPLTFLTLDTEQLGNPKITALGISQKPVDSLSAGGNMEGKETRFGIASSTLWATATTASGNGAVNATMDSFIPAAGLLPLWLIQMSEVVFGGVGSGLATLLIFVILTVFTAGLMVGRTPEYLGKKIEPYEMKMASFTVLIMPLMVLLSTAAAVVLKQGTASIANAGPHGLTEILYAFSSMINNNGSAFAGLNANTPFYNILGAIGMFVGRYWIALPTLAIAGSLARKKTLPANAGTLPTDDLLFVILLVAVIVVLGALTFFPVLALGPIVEQLMLWNYHGY